MNKLENQCTILNTVSVPSTISQLLQQPSELNDENSPYSGFKIIGGITNNLKYTWMANGPRFQVIDIRTGNRLASWLFSGFFRNKKCHIRCVVELPDDISENIPLFIIGLECELNGGLICIFDVIGNKILKLIQTDYPVSNLYVVDSGCKSNEFLNLPGMLKTLDGVLAVGMDGGDTYLMDLCRDIWIEDSNTLLNEFSCSKLVIRPCKNLNLGLLETFKTYSAQNQNHLALQLNELSAPHIFTLATPQDKGTKALDLRRSEVKITSLLYVPKLVSLLVGYNFGAWQIYNLLTLELEYTSAVYEELVPVSHFAYQEPSDDPRAFCYVWAVYSDDSNSEHSNIPLAALYTLAYETKENIEDYGVLYQKLISCSLRFQMDLLPLTNDLDCKGGSCIAIQPYVNPTNLDNSIDQRLTLCMLVWCVWSMDYNTCSETVMAIFDLDQWYKEQMPATISDDEKDCYLAKFNLNEILSIDDIDSPVLDIKIDLSTISSFLTTQRLEEHYYPSSLAFDFICIQNSKFTYIKNYGMQRRLLLGLEENGTEAFLKPDILAQKCIQAGLQPISTDVTPRVKQSPRYQLLSIALEYNLIKLLTTCAEQWATGAYASFGCTLGMFVEWACQRSETLQQKANELCVSLFDYSDINLDCNARQILNQCAKQIHHLAAIFKVISKTCVNDLNEEGRAEINEQLRAIEMFSERLDVLQWLLNVGLLPEAPASAYVNPVNTSEGVRAPYPADELINYYNNRRSELNQLCGIPPLKAASVPCELLFIDNLIEYECGGEKLRSEWRRDAPSKNNVGLYPPYSIQALLRTYLIDNVNVEIKHTILVYVFLDLAMALDRTKYSNIITHLIKFPAVFRLTPYHIKITQAFWQLDHGDFETGMEQILDPLTSGIGQEEFKSWQHRTVLRMLLANKEHKYAALYIQIRQPSFSDVNEICDAINLLLMNDMLHTAFEFQRRHRTNQNKHIILKKFFKKCQKTNLLIPALKLSYTKEEEEVLIDVLKEDTKFGTNLLLVYYLQRSRGYEAIRSNHKNLREHQLGLTGQDSIELPDVLLNMYIKSMPKISKSIFENFQLNHNQISEANHLNNEENKPVPLSITPKNENHIKRKSNFISESIMKIREIWKNENKTQVDELESTPFLCAPKRKEIVRSTTVPIVYPKMIYQDDENLKKRPTDLTDEDISLQHHPNKRFKTVCGKSVPVKYTATEKLVLTPIVKRKTSDSFKTKVENQQTPQSILKVKSVSSNITNDSNHIMKTATPTADVSLNNDFDVEESIDKNESTKSSATINNKLFAPTPRRSLVRTPKPVVHFEDTLTDTSPEEKTDTVEDDKKDSSIKISEELSDDVFYSSQTTPTEQEEAVKETVQAETENKICKTVQEEVGRITRKLASPYRPYSSIKPRKSLQRTVLETSLAKTIAPVLTKVATKSTYSLRSSVSSEPDSCDEFADNVPCASSPLKSQKEIQKKSRTKKINEKRTKINKNSKKNTESNVNEAEIKHSDEQILSQTIESLPNSLSANDNTNVSNLQDTNKIDVESNTVFMNLLENSEMSESTVNRVREKLRIMYGRNTNNESHFNQTTDLISDSLKSNDNKETSANINETTMTVQDTVFISSLENSEMTDSTINRAREQLRALYGSSHDQTTDSFSNIETSKNVKDIIKTCEESISKNSSERSDMKESTMNQTCTIGKTTNEASNIQSNENQTAETNKVFSESINKITTEAEFTVFMNSLENSDMGESTMNRVREKLRAIYQTSNDQSSINQTTDSISNNSKTNNSENYENSQLDINKKNADVADGTLFLNSLENSDLSESVMNRIREKIRATYGRSNNQSVDDNISEHHSTTEVLDDTNIADTKENLNVEIQENIKLIKKDSLENDNFRNFQPSPTSDSFFLKLIEDSEVSNRIIKTIQEKLFEDSAKSSNRTLLNDLKSSSSRQVDTTAADNQEVEQKNTNIVQLNTQEKKTSEKDFQKQHNNSKLQCTLGEAVEHNITNKTDEQTETNISQQIECTSNVIKFEIERSHKSALNANELESEQNVVEEIIIEKVSVIRETEDNLDEEMEVDENMSEDNEGEDGSSENSNKQIDSNHEENDSKTTDSEENSESSENEENIYDKEDIKDNKNEVIEISSESSDEDEPNEIEEVENEEYEEQSEEDIDEEQSEEDVDEEQSEEDVDEEQSEEDIDELQSEENIEEEQNFEKSESSDEDKSNSCSSDAIKIGRDDNSDDSVKSYVSDKDEAKHKENKNEIEENEVSIKVDNSEVISNVEVLDTKCTTNVESINIAVENYEEISNIPQSNSEFNKKEVLNNLYQRDPLLAQNDEKLDEPIYIYSTLEQTQNIEITLEDKNILNEDVACLITDEDPINGNQSEIKNDILLSQNEEKIEVVRSDDIYTNLESSQNITVDSLDKNVFSRDVSYLITDDDSVTDHQKSKIVESTMSVEDSNPQENQVVKAIENVNKNKKCTEELQDQRVQLENENKIQDIKQTENNLNISEQSEEKLELKLDAEEMQDQKVQLKSNNNGEDIEKTEDNLNISEQSEEKHELKLDAEETQDQKIQLKSNNNSEDIEKTEDNLNISEQSEEKLELKLDAEETQDQKVQLKSNNNSEDIEKTEDNLNISEQTEEKLEIKLDAREMQEQKIQLESDNNDENVEKTKEKLESEMNKSTTKVQVKLRSRRNSTDSSNSILTEISDKPLRRSRRAKSLTVDIPEIKDVEKVIPRTRRGRSASFTQNENVDNNSNKNTSRSRRSRTTSPQNDTKDNSHNISPDNINKQKQLNTIKEQEEEEEALKIPEKNIKSTKSIKKHDIIVVDEKNNEQNLLAEYSSSRRLTRKQKLLLEKSLESSKMNILIEKLSDAPEEISQNDPNDQQQKRLELSPTTSSKTNSSINTDGIVTRNKTRIQSNELESPSTPSRRLRRTRAGSVDVIMETKKKTQKISSSVSDIMTPSRRVSRRLSQSSEISEKDDTTSESGSISGRTRKRSADALQNIFNNERELRRSPRHSKEDLSSSSQSSLPTKTTRKTARRSVLDTLTEEKDESSKQTTEDLSPSPAKRTRKHSRNK